MSVLASGTLWNAIRKRTLRDDTELEEFAGRFGQRGNPVSIEYLRRGSTKAFYDEGGSMFAGYVVNSSTPLRYLDWIPEAQRASFKASLQTDSVSEITCIWIARKPHRVSSELVYLSSVLDALRSGAEITLGGTLNRSVYGIQTQVLSRLYYSGTTECFGRPRDCWVYGASRIELALRLVTQFPTQIVLGLMGKANYLGQARRRSRQLPVPALSHGR